jgi:hypothetical protein
LTVVQIDKIDHFRRVTTAKLSLEKDRWAYRLLVDGKSVKTGYSAEDFIGLDLPD